MKLSLPEVESLKHFDSSAAQLTLSYEDSGDGSAEFLEAATLTFQALAAMSLWMRMLQMLNLSPTSGPLLLMAMRMMEVEFALPEAIHVSKGEGVEQVGGGLGRAWGRGVRLCGEVLC